MILADKIIEERKKLGLSQEELAEKLSVSRQSVSKWESAQSVPDLQKIILMSELFSVTTDYLLKENSEPEHKIAAESEPDRTVRRVSMEDANDFLTMRRAQSKNVALGVMLCILSPVLLILLAGFSDAGIGGFTEKAASAIGLFSLFVLVAAAVFLFVPYASKAEPFAFLEKEEIETAYGVTGLVKEKRAAYEPTYIRFLSLGILLCVFSPLPLILTAILYESDALITSMVSLLLCVVAIGVYLIVRVAMVKSGYEMLLQEGDYTQDKKKTNIAADTVADAYWSIAVAVYLAWSFLSGNWSLTWIVWPIAGVLFVPFVLIAKRLLGVDIDND